jgi:hypothetical protein
MSEDNNVLYNVPSGCLSSLIGVFLAFLVCLLLSLLLAGCKGKEYITERVEVPVVVTQEHTVESVKIDHIRDTLIQRDSIYHYIKGDTTIIERWHYLQGRSSALRVDTLHIYDSVPYPVTTTKEVVEVKEVNILHWWQKLFIAIGGGSLIALALAITYRLRKRT